MILWGGENSLLKLSNQYSIPILMLLASLAMMPIGDAYAQSPGESIEDRQFQRQREQTERLFKELRTPPSGENLTAPEVHAPIEDGACVPIDEVRIDGMSRFKSVRFKSEINAATGSCISMNEINGLLRAMTNAYVERGFVAARALLPEQDLAAGILKIAVIEGVVEKVRGEGSSVKSAALDFAFPGMEGDILNLRDLEQGIDQLSRLPSNNPTIDIAPGAAPGGSIVVIKNEKAKNRFRGTLSADNYGQRSTGRYNHAASFEADNLLGLNDFWSFSGNRDAEYGDGVGARGYNGFFSLPYGYWTLTLSGGRFSYDSLITGTFADFDSDGDSWNFSADLDRLIYRDSKRKLSLNGGLRITDTDNFIEDVRLLASSYRLAVVNFGARYQQRAHGGVLSGSIEARRGLDALGSESIITGADGPQRTFWKIGGSLSFFKPFEIASQEFRYTGAINGQWADRNLFPAERISLGGPTTVRGFIDGGLSGDRGVYIRQQFGTEVSRIETNVKALDVIAISVFAAYDVGGIYRDGNDPFERGVLQSVSSGIALSAGRFSGQVNVAHAFDHPDFLNPKDIEVTATVAVSF